MGKMLGKDIARRYPKLLPWKDGKGEIIGYILTPPAPKIGTFIVLHGNGGTAFTRYFVPKALNAHGYRTLLYEYPGFGWRSGYPTKSAIVPELRQLVREVNSRGLGPVYFWAESLGTGVACEGVSDEVKGVVLVSPFDTLEHAAVAQYPIIPVSYLFQESENYDSVKGMTGYTGRVCVVLDTSDEVVPANYGRALYKGLTCHKALVTITGGLHTQIPSESTDRFWSTVLHNVHAE